MRAADLVVRAVKEPPSQRKHFSVSSAGSPTKPLTPAVGPLHSSFVELDIQFGTPDMTSPTFGRIMVWPSLVHNVALHSYLMKHGSGRSGENPAHQSAAKV